MEVIIKWDEDDQLVRDYEAYLESIYSLTLYDDEGPYPEDELEEF